MSLLRYPVKYRVWDRFGLRFLDAGEIALDANGALICDQPERYDVDLDTTLRAQGGAQPVYANDIVEAIVRGVTVREPILWFDGAWRLAGIADVAADFPILRVVGNLHEQKWPTTAAEPEQLAGAI